MNAIAKALAYGLHVQTNVTTQSVCRSDDKWHMQDAGGSLYGPFDLLISTAPPEQTQALFGHLSRTLAEPISSVTMAPCWTVMLQLREPLQVPFDAAFVHNSPLSWIARNSSKPGRGGTDCWILHATGEWSQNHLEESADALAKSLIEHFWQATDQCSQTPEFVAAHRWRYALPIASLPQRFVLDRNLNLGACGDWCGGPRVEGAFLSGLAIADCVLEGW
jgi:predicted NAD/FAD-dependent oxidoreductase